MGCPNDPEVAEWMGMDTDRESAILADASDVAA